MSVPYYLLYSMGPVDEVQGLDTSVREIPSKGRIVQELLLGDTSASLLLTSVFSSASARVTSRFPSLQGEQSSTTEIQVLYSGNFRLKRIFPEANLGLLYNRMYFYTLYNFWTLHCKVWMSRHSVLQRVTLRSIGNVVFVLGGAYICTVEPLLDYGVYSGTLYV